ncbi:MAG: type II toxin-antitoxin system YafQ family toxin [Treponema sp.]|nr:type II toxin-antitoxin system YafQ family toxin [Treponema sp.]
MRDWSFTNQFKKDMKLMEKRHKDMDKLYDIMAKLIFGESLPERCREHNLSGDLAGLTDCHIEGDWLLLYRKSYEKVVFYYTGTHSDLFKK